MQNKVFLRSAVLAITLLLILMVLNLSVLSVSASDSNNSANQNSTCKAISIYFFYGQGCPHCVAIEPIVKATCEQCNVSFKSYEIYYNTSNRELFMDFLKRYCVPVNESGVPAIFVGSTSLIGSEAIAQNLKDAIKFAQENDIHAENYVKNCTIPPKPFEVPTIATVIGAAIIDSINPCAIGVLIIFITFLFYSKNFSRARMVVYGLIYIASIFFTYFLAGLGILKFLNFMYNLGVIIFVNGLVIAILLIGVFLAFRDAYVSLKKDKKKGLYLAIPKSTKGTLEKYIKKGTLPAAIILGILMAIVELPCTGQIYLGILTVLNTMDFGQGILLLIIYNIIFVLPLAIILLFALFGKNLSEIFEKKTEESWIVRYLIGWTMLFLAIILINEIFKFLNFYLSLPAIITSVITLSHAQFFIFAVISIVLLFIIFSILRPIVKKRINIWYCAYCYACALTWVFIAVLYMFGIDVPKILLAALIGMSLTGIWEEFKKFNFKYFGLFTIFISVFGISLMYALFVDDKFAFFLLVLLLFAMDGIIALKNFEMKTEEKEEEKIDVKKEIKKRKDEEKEGKKSLSEMLDHCCD